MGAVYRARDVQLDRWVAVKCLLDVSKETSRNLAAKEARTLASLNHRNIMRVFDILQSGDQVWIVSEWLEGKSLAQLPLPLPPAFVLAIMAQIYDALASAHSAQVIHRDVKPANIIFGVDGRVTLIDFGVAFAPGCSTGETLVGSLRYSDPRILEGESPDAASDLFSAALLQVELMTGETVLPDLAPLPLYRHIKKHLRPRLDQLLDGTYPPLADLARGSLKRFDRNGTARLSRDTQDLTTQALTLLRRITPLPPEQYLASTLCKGHMSDTHADNAIALELEGALADATLTPRQKAPWYAFKANQKPQAIVYAVAKPPATVVRLRTRSQRGRARVQPYLHGKRLFWTIATTVALGLIGTIAGKRRLAPQAPGEQTPDHSLTIEETVTPPTALQVRPEIALKASDATLTPAIAEFEGPATASNKASLSDVNPAATKPLPKPDLVPLHLAANAWAVVVIDGHEVGRLPQAAPFLVPPGKHNLRLENPTVETLATELAIEAGAPKKLHFKLQTKAVPRTIKLGVPGRLFVDGIDQGIVTSKTITLSYGTHDVSIRRGNRIIKQKRVALGPDSPRDIIVE